MKEDKKEEFVEIQTQDSKIAEKELTKKQVILYIILLSVAIIICVLAMVGVNIFVLLIIIFIVFLYVYFDEDIRKDEVTNKLRNNGKNTSN